MDNFVFREDARDDFSFDRLRSKIPQVSKIFVYNFYKYDDIGIKRKLNGTIPFLSSNNHILLLSSFSTFTLKRHVWNKTHE